jgi:hypothetical protein
LLGDFHLDQFTSDEFIKMRTMLTENNIRIRPPVVEDDTASYVIEEREPPKNLKRRKTVVGYSFSLKNKGAN